jgi:hypothetical protein
MACSLCRADIQDGAGLCPHHVSAREAGWAEANRIMCDLIHRGREPRRRPPGDRDGDVWVEECAEGRMA